MGLKLYTIWGHQLLTLPPSIVRTGKYQRNSCAVPVFQRFFLILCANKVKNRSITSLALSAMLTKMNTLSKYSVKICKKQACVVGSLLSIRVQENVSPKKLQRLFVFTTNFYLFSQNIRSKAHG